MAAQHFKLHHRKEHCNVHFILSMKIRMSDLGPPSYLFSPIHLCHFIPTGVNALQGEEPLHDQVKLTLLRAKQQLADILAAKDREVSQIHEKMRAELQCKDKEIQHLKLENSRLSEDVAALEKNDARKTSVLKRKLAEAVGDTFTPTQIDCMIEGKKKCHWTEEDIARGVTLRSISSKSYKYIRQHLNFPFPGDTTIYDWIKNINCEPGLQKSSLRLMKHKSTDMPLKDRVCMVLFDEMSLSEEYCFDKKADKVYIPHSKALVAMAVGLIGPSWRQPIYYNFDAKMDGPKGPILKNLIEELEDCGFPVHAVCCDLGGGNHGFMSRLGIGWSGKRKPYFINPKDSNRKIHFFCDVPHMMKLIRNTILDRTIITPNGKVTKEPLEQLVAYEEKGVFKKAFKISSTHLKVSGAERQRVNLAVQVLSNTVGLALVDLGEKGKITSEFWKALSELILLSDKWFDTFNVSQISQLTAPFTANVNQMAILTSMINLMKKSKVEYWSEKRQKLEYRSNPFQKGIIVSSLSLINLSEDLKKLYGNQYILTRRLNQDALEHLFGIIRQMGGSCDHPNTLDFKHRMKKYIIGRRTALTASKPNTISKDPCVKLTETDNNTIKHLEAFSSPIGRAATFLRQEETASTSNSAIDTSNDEMSLTGIFFDSMDIDIEEDNDEFEIPDSEQDGFNYVLGWISHKFPELADSPRANVNDWIGKKSKIGGLKRMKEDFIPKFTRMEQIFRKLHGDNIREGKNAIKDLLAQVEDMDGISEKMKQFYFTTRMHFQIRFLNKMKKSSKPKKLRKLAKVVN